MNLNKNSKKIVVKPDYELTDLIREIKKVNEDRLVLTFTEPTDLLVSPIALEVLQEEADLANKILVAQVIQNPTGERNAESAGIETISHTDEIPESLWDRLEGELKQRLQEREEMLKKERSSKQVTPTPVPDKHSDAEQKHVEDTAKVAEGDISGEQDPEIEDNSGTTGKEHIEGQEVVQKENPEETKRELTPFQKRVRNVLEKSQQDMDKKGKIVEEGGVAIALGQDLDNERTPEKKISTASKQDKVKPNQENSLTGRDFKSKSQAQGFKPGRSISGLSSSDIKPQDRRKGDKSTAGISGFGAGGLGNIKKSFSGVFSKINTKKLKKNLLVTLIPVLLLLLTIGYFVYKNAPFVSAKVFIESRPVSLQQEFTGSPNGSGFDAEQGIVEVKKEVATKGVSDSKDATGTDFTGEAATGLVTFKCLLLDEELNVPSGTTITSEDGLKFQTQSDISMICPAQESVTVVAAEKGEEYNLQSGTTFTIDGYTIDEVVVVNDLSSFSGGYKEEFKVVSQKDADKLVKDLKKQAQNENKSELKSQANNGWKLIESSIKHEVIDDPEIDPAVGTEADIVNVSVEIKSTALYYKESDITENEEDILIQEAQEKNLFQTDEELELELDDDIQTSIELKNVQDEKVTLNVKISGSVKPSINTESLSQELQGMGLEEGQEYIRNLSYSVEEPVIEFTPEWFPESLRHFPDKQGKVKITFEEVESETAEEEGGGENPTNPG
jgi:hypothetical protein